LKAVVKGQDVLPTTSFSPRSVDEGRCIRGRDIKRIGTIYESGEVKRAGADSVSREFPHIPLAVGVGRSGPSQTPPTVPGHAPPAHIP
jgi:hypothetical protein